MRKKSIYVEGERTFISDRSGNLITKEGYTPGNIKEMRKAYGALSIALEADAVSYGQYLQATRTLLRDGLGFISKEDLSELEFAAKTVDKISPKGKLTENLQTDTTRAISLTLQNQTERIKSGLENLRRAA